MTYACPLCGDATNARGERFTDVSQVVAHIDGSTDDRHDGERGRDHVDAIEAAAAATSDGGTAHGTDDGQPETDAATAPSADTDRVEELNGDVVRLRVKFDRVVQEKQRQIDELQERLGAHRLAIKELQAGLEALAEEHDKDVEYQFEL